MIDNALKNSLPAKSRLVRLLIEPVMGYTRLVFATKFLLLTLAVVIIVTLIIIPVFNPVHDNFRISFSSVEEHGEGKDPTMINPRFQGVDKDDQTYNISATTAVKSKDNILTLNDINADINLRDGSWVAMLAGKGIFTHTKNTLELSQDVSLFTYQGYEFFTPEVFVDIGKNAAYAHQPVKGNGPVGTLQADELEIQEKGNYAKFSGHVKVVLYPEGFKKIKRDNP